MTRIAREFAEAILLALLLFLILQLSIQNFRVEGYSMRPTLMGDEFVIVNKLKYLQIETSKMSRLIPFWHIDDDRRSYTFFSRPPRRGDIIVFDSPTDSNKDLVKRIIGLPGENIIIAGSKIFVNNQELEERYLNSIKLTESMQCIPNTDNCVLGKDEYFVMGDNRELSSDSRNWGPVHLSDMIGKVWVIYWPLDLFSTV